MEIAEAIDSVSWKHWKNVDGWIDYENFRLEMIDIWHFLMSYILTFYEIEDASKLIIDNMKQKSDIKLPLVFTKEDNSEIDEILSVYEDLMIFALINPEDYEFDDYLDDFVKQYFICLDSASISFNNLYSLYIGKNVLNKFRQENWYKEWTYKKIWSNWKEDNVIMQEILKTNPLINFQELYIELEKEYLK